MSCISNAGSARHQDCLFLPTSYSLSPYYNPICSMTGKVTGSRAAFSGARLAPQTVSNQRLKNALRMCFASGWISLVGGSRIFEY
jgi:hypothetical protein